MHGCWNLKAVQAKLPEFGFPEPPGEPSRLRLSVQAEDQAEGEAQLQAKAEGEAQAQAEAEARVQAEAQPSHKPAARHDEAIAPTPNG